MGSCHLAERPQEIAPAELAAAEDTPPDSEDRELWGDPIFLASFDKAEEDHHRRKSLGSEQQVHQSPASLPLGSPYRIGDLNPGSFPSSPRWESTDDLAEGCRKEEGDSEAARVDLFGANEPGGADAARDDEQQQEEDDQNSVNPMLDFMHYSCSQLEWVPIRRKDESAIDCDDKEDSDDEEWDGDAGVFSTEEDEQCPESSGTPSRGVDTLCGLELGDWAQEKDILKEGNKEGLSAPKADASMPEDRPGLCVKERQAGTVQTSRTAEPSRMLPPSRKRRHANADVIGGQSKLHRWFHQGNGGVGWRSASAVCGNRKMDEADDEAEQQDPEDKLAMEGTQVEGRMLRLYRDHVHSMKQARARCKVLAKKTIKVPDEGHFTYAFKPAIWQCISNFVDDLDSDRMAGSTQGGSLTQSNLTQCTQMARQPREFVPKVGDADLRGALYFGKPNMA